MPQKLLSYVWTTPKRIDRFHLFAQYPNYDGCAHRLICVYVSFSSSDTFQFLFCHILVTGVFYGFNQFTIYQITPHLPKKNIVRANINFGIMAADTIGNGFRFYCPFYKKML